MSGYLLAVFAGMCWGLAAAVARLAIAGTNYGTLPSLISSTAAIPAFYLLLLLTRAPVRRRISRPGLIAILLAGITIGVGNIFYFFALTLAPVSVVVPLVGATPLFTILLARFFEPAERISGWLVFGALLIVAGGALVATA